MRRIRILDRDAERFEYRSDVERICLALRTFEWDADLETCRELWQRYSDSMCAGWMCVPDDDGEILTCVSSYFEADE